MKIFISYSSPIKEVAEFAKKLESKLDKVSETFIFQNPKKHPAGVTWGSNLAEKIRDCDAFIAIITQGYLDSDMCHKEFHAAHFIHKKLIIPIVFEDPKFKADYKKGQYGAAIEMVVKPIQWVIFKTTDVEESASEGKMSPYEQVLNGLGLKVVPEAEKQTTPTPTMVSPVSRELSVLEKLLQTKSLTEERLSLACDEKLFLELSSQIPRCDLTLVLSLGLTYADEQHIKKNKDNEKDRIIATLVKWKEKNGSDATYLALVKIFIRHENRELAEFILDYFISL